MTNTPDLKQWSVVAHSVVRDVTLTPSEKVDRIRTIASEMGVAISRREVRRIVWDLLPPQAIEALPRRREAASAAYMERAARRHREGSQS
jgi:hypothetical protein